MFLLRLAIVFLTTSSIYSQDKLVADNQEKGYAFGKLRLSEDGKTEELISSPNTIIPPLNQDQSAGNAHPLPSPCVGARPATKIPYPKEKTKYILCRDEYHYEIYTCANGGEWNEETGSCSFVDTIFDKCEQEKPCLYDGQCLSLSNSTFKCICRPEWTGERCEIPLNSCSKKPCGPGAECRTLKTTKFDQDYVCICNGKRGYGLSCQEIVPNPCLKSTQQYYPYAFSAHAYIQCDGDLIHFQPCGSLLYWNQEDKNCDHKRPDKTEMPKLISKLTANKDDYQGEKETEMIDREKIIIVHKPIEQENTLGQKVSESSTTFVSNQVENRPQLTTNLQPVLTNKLRSDFVPQTQQWSSQEQPRGSSFGTESSLLGSKTAQTQFGLNNEAQQPRFGGQQWSNSRSNMNTQSNEKKFAPVDSWRTADSQSNQMNSQNSNQQPVDEMNVKESNVFRLQGSQKFVQPQTWQTNTQLERGQQNPTFDAKPQNNQQFMTQTQPWSKPAQQTFTQTNNRLPSSVNQNTQEQVPSWQARPTTHLSTNQLPQTSNFNTQSTQTANAPREAWRRFDFRTGSANLEAQNSNTGEKAQSWQMKTPTSMTENQFPQKNDSFVMQTRSFEEPQQSWRRAEAALPFEHSQNSNSQPSDESIKTGSNTWNGQNFRGQHTSQPVQKWQRFDSHTNEQTPQNVNQPSFDQNSRLESNTFVSQNIQNGKVEEQDWKNKFSAPETPKPKSKPTFFFRPKFETERKSNQQENVLSAQIPNNQFESNQQQTGTPVESTLEQKQSWTSNQQFPTQGGQHLSNNNDANMQKNRFVQPSVTQGLQNWQKTQTSVQNPQDEE